MLETVLSHLYESASPNLTLSLFCKLLVTGFVRVLENLESPGILFWHFPGLESPGKRLLVLESPGNLFNSSKKYEMYGRQ